MRLGCLGVPVALAAGAWASAQASTPATEPAGHIRDILDLQPYKRTSTLSYADPAGRRIHATLVEINPASNDWALLKLEREGDPNVRVYHLENGDRSVRLRLAADGLELTPATGANQQCVLWRSAGAEEDATPLERAVRAGLPYVPLCDGHLFLRNRVRGTRTRIERITDLLRDHVWGGDQIVTFVRDTFYKDAFIEQARTGNGGQAAVPPAGPRSARLAPGPASIQPMHLGIDLTQRGADGRPLVATALAPGRWYPVTGSAGVYVSAIQPKTIEPALLQGDRGVVAAMDSVEADAVDYLVAFDLSRFELGFALGTDHPRVDWSDRAPDSQRAESAGPDGIGTTAPLATTGMVNPALLPRVAATFTGGFKREHGAFRYGALSQRNRGSHYGFIEHGTVFSTLQPGLSTLYVLDDGSINMKTWTEADRALLPRIRDARQNGVPLIEFDAAGGLSSPGDLVNNWGAGNWSGSANDKLRTLRAGTCLQDSGSKRYLVYGYFSTATPAAMVRVFQAYGCRYAMHLDMNALEHTYMALYSSAAGELRVQHLIRDMAEVDKKGGTPLAPRFLSFPDDRDFFYLLRRPEPQ